MGEQITAENLIKQLPTALYRWYPFKADESLLYLYCDGTENAEPVITMLKERKHLKVTVRKVSDLAAIQEGERFPYIVLGMNVPECVRQPEEFLSRVRKLLTDSGILLFGVHNRLGIRYFCGDRDPFTDHSFDGIEGYCHSYGKTETVFAGRAYDGAELEHLLEKAGLQKAGRYSVFPGLENPAMLFRENYLPAENLGNRIFPQYHYRNSVFLEEKGLYDTLIENGMFHTMANAYLFECTGNVLASEAVPVSDALQVTSSLDRGYENALITVIHQNHTVTKAAAYEEGIQRIRMLDQNMAYLKNRGIPVVDGHLEGDTYVMPFVDAPTGEAYLRHLLETDPKEFVQRLDEFRTLINTSSEEYDGIFHSPVSGAEDKPTHLLKKAFLDLVPLNSFFLNGEFVFFDQEICESDYPADYIMHRVIQIAHDGSPKHQALLDKGELFRRYGLADGVTGEPGEKNRYFTLDRQIMSDLRNENILEGYYRQVRQNPGIMHTNRERMNYSAADYKRLFEDVFEGIGTRKVILFGSGRYARIFLTRFGARIHVTAALDNDEKRQGGYLYPEGYEAMIGMDPEEAHKRAVPVMGPTFLDTFRHGEYKVIICIKNHMAVMKQLDTMGIHEYAVYDPAGDYRIPEEVLTANKGKGLEEASSIPVDGKKYHIGYTAGAFDMFHVGHLNLLRRAKEMCDHLIVGVMSDEAIRDFKKKEPVIPFADRLEIIKACRYVDEAVEIPYMRGDSAEVWKLYHFDVQFCGSDYIGNEGRMREKAFLEEHGATLEIFPYTEKVSSTMLREQLREQDE